MVTKTTQTKKPTKPNGAKAKPQAVQKRPVPSKSAKKPARKPLPIFKVPADFKPHFLLVQFATEKDGLIGTAVRATRYMGRFDREVDDKKKFDVGAYDAPTLMGIAARLAAVSYRPNADKKFPVSPAERASVKGGHRLPASTHFQVLMRVGKKSADSSITTGIKQIWQVVQSAKTGRQALKELEKTDPAYRTIRKASRILPAAFKEVQMPPKRSRRTKADSQEEE